jgi:hypothetical protein
LQVDVELSVREGVPCPVRDMDGQRRLAHAADARQRRHRHHPALGRRRRRQHLAQLGHEGHPAGEVRDAGGQLGRAHRRGRGLRGQRGRGFREARVRLQDALLEFLEAGPRVHAQLVRQQPPGVRVRGQRLRLPARAVQRQHQQFAQPLPQRMGRGERREFGDRLRVAALLQVHVEPGLDELEPPLLQAGALGFRVRARDARQDLAVPQAQRLVQQGARVAQVARRLRLLGVGRQLLGQREVQRSAHAGPSVSRTA